MLAESQNTPIGPKGQGRTPGGPPPDQTFHKGRKRSQGSRLSEDSKVDAPSDQDKAERRDTWKIHKQKTDDG